MIIEMDSGVIINQRTLTAAEAGKAKKEFVSRASRGMQPQQQLDFREKNLCFLKLPICMALTVLDNTIYLLNL